MNTQTELTRLRQQRAATVKTTERLKMRLLLGVGILVLCTLVLEYSVVKLEQPMDAELKLSLLITVLSLPTYFMVLFVWEHLHARRQRRELAKMITQLSDEISAEVIMKERPSLSATIKKGRIDKNDTLVRKIVQMINA